MDHNVVISAGEQLEANPSSSSRTLDQRPGHAVSSCHGTFVSSSIKGPKSHQAYRIVYHFFCANYYTEFSPKGANIKLEGDKLSLKRQHQFKAAKLTLMESLVQFDYSKLSLKGHSFSSSKGPNSPYWRVWHSSSTANSI